MDGLFGQCKFVIRWRIWLVQLQPRDFIPAGSTNPDSLDQMTGNQDKKHGSLPGGCGDLNIQVMAWKLKSRKEALRQQHVVDHTAVCSAMRRNDEVVKGLAEVCKDLSVNSTIRLNIRDLERCVERIVHLGAEMRNENEL